ncbi:MAG: type IV pilus biogenesis/stability protein PilW [Pseudomonadales bacterium]|nr:type IV pilus biogenesis/stability protein PilW [Pseudomonadales bacterium]
MTGKTVLQALAPMLGGLLLTACVTTSTGGFNADVSEERALQDYLRLSAGYLEQGDLVNAKRHLNNAIAIDANNSEAFGIWGLVYAREGEATLAEQNFRRALRLDAGNSQARNNFAAFLFASRRFQDAYEQLAIVVQDTAYAARPQAFENMGLSALRLERRDDAENAFNRALQLNGNLPRSSLELTDINLQKENVVQARAYYQNFLTVSQYLNVAPSARSLWIGIQLYKALGNERLLQEYGETLEARFADSQEVKLYRQSASDE